MSLRNLHALAALLAATTQSPRARTGRGPASCCGSIAGRGGRWAWSRA